MGLGAFVVEQDLAGPRFAGEPGDGGIVRRLRVSACRHRNYPDLGMVPSAMAFTITGTSAWQCGHQCAAGQPTLVVFLAHWCPHCQAEVPVIVKAIADWTIPEIRAVAVATGTNA